MKPGTFPFCSDCLHQAVAMAAAGHPNPCHFDRRSNGPAVPPTGNTNTPARVNTVAGVATAAAMIDDEAA